MTATPALAAAPRMTAAIAAISLAAGVWCLSDLLTGSRLPIYRDLLTFVYPYRAFVAEHLARGDLPLWNPFVQLGVPFLASLHASVLYPPSLILLVPMPLGFNLFLAVHFVIGWLGAVAWFRERGASFPEGALVGALVFALGGYLVAAVTNTAHLQAAVWAPWIFFTWHRFRVGRGGLVAPALLIVVQLLAGAPEVWMCTLALLGLVTIFHGPSNFRERVHGMAGLVACVLLALGLAAFQLLPTLEYLTASRRASHLSFEELTYWSASPVSLLQLIFPPSTALTSEAEKGMIGEVLAPSLPLVHSIYLGIIGLCLAVSGVVRGRDRFLWTSVSIFGVLLSLGPGSPLYPFLLDSLPGLLGRIRYPEKFLFLFHVCASVLAAEGATAIARRDRVAVRASVAAAVTLGAVALFLTSLAWIEPVYLIRVAAILSGEGGWPMDAFTAVSVDLAYKAERALWLFAAWSVLAGLLIRDRIRPSLFWLLVLALLAGDLASTHRGLWVSVPVEKLERAPVRIDVDVLRANRQRLFHYATTTGPTPVPGLVAFTGTIRSRTDLLRDAIRNWQTLSFGIGMLHGVGNLSSGDSIADQPVLGAVLASLPRDRAIDLLGAFGIATLVGFEELPPTENVNLTSGEEGGPFVYRVRSALPFAFLGAEVEPVADQVDALIRLSEDSFPRNRRAIVTSIPDGWVHGSGPLAPDEGVISRSLGPDDLEFEVTSRATRLLVVNSSHAPGWRATVDGESAEIVRANALVQGVVVSPGHHLVSLAYRPTSFRLGIVISLATLACIAITRRIAGRGRRGEPTGSRSRWMLRAGRQRPV